MEKLNKKIIIQGKIKAETGLAIGGSNTSMGIGGVDKGVIRNVVSGEPYIPGSTLKGKMRALLELQHGTIHIDEKSQIKHTASRDYKHRTTKLFGNASGDNDSQRPSRVIVRDATLCDIQQKFDGTEIGKKEFFSKTDLPFTEVKTEVVIDRITSKAMPRQIERVPAGAIFKFEMVLNVFEGEAEQQLVEDLFSAMQLVQNDYIGGSGSRGSGQISFMINSVKERNIKFYEFESEEKNLTTEYSKYFPR